MLAHALYVLAAIVGVTCLLLAGFAVTGLAWFKNVFRAWDYLGAALFGGDGRHSISAYCGARPSLHALRVIVDALFGKGHCFQAAKKEGLLA